MPPRLRCLGITIPQIFWVRTDSSVAASPSITPAKRVIALIASSCSAQPAMYGIESAENVEADARADDVRGAVDDHLAGGSLVGVVASVVGVAELVNQDA